VLGRYDGLLGGYKPIQLRRERICVTD
jgi:hypothetical protein